MLTVEELYEAAEQRGVGGATGNLFEAEHNRALTGLVRSVAGSSV